MHRSGTSALARSLLTLGVDLGNHLMEPVSDVNAKGFWEDLDIYRLDEEMLQTLDTQWYHSTLLTEAQLQELFERGFLERAAELLRTKCSDERPFGFKDPRLCRLLPFWQRVLESIGGEVAYVLALRNPASIADSLQKRDRIDRTQSYLMWMSHTLQSVLQTSGAKRVLVDFDSLLHDPKRQIRWMARKLNLSIQPKALENYASEFLDRDLRHCLRSWSDVELDPACPTLVTACYRELITVTAGRKSLDAPVLQKRLYRLWQQLQELQPITMAIDRMMDEHFKSH